MLSYVNIINGYYTNYDTAYYKIIHNSFKTNSACRNEFRKLIQIPFRINVTKEFQLFKYKTILTYSC